MHKPIQFKDLSLSFSHKTCFSDFSGQILYGSRIAIIGRNGEGKSTLLKILQGASHSFEGSLMLPPDLRVGYLPQLIDTCHSLSGGERLNRALTDALCQDPNLLLLDEPTNHLDQSNRRALIKHLRRYQGTLLVVTHDVELLKNLVDTLWHIQHEKVHVFHGSYDDYRRCLAAKTLKIENELALLKQQKKEAHLALMKEQARGKQMRMNGEKNIAQRKWPTVRSHTKLGNAVETGDKRLHQIKAKKETLIEELAMIYQPDEITPQFQLTSSSLSKSAITIREGSVSYTNGPLVLEKIDFHLPARARVALLGDNGSGKSTFIRAILADKGLKKTGDWTVLKPSNIGYLDQHYQNLSADKTVFEMLSSIMPASSYTEIRKHLNDFLFRKNEEIEARIANLSGGEKARLSLCCIAASSPALLILDEMTNNLDLETREHVIQVLKNYPQAMLVVSHDAAFLKAINIERTYLIHQGGIQWVNDGLDDYEV